MSNLRVQVPRPVTAFTLGSAARDIRESTPPLSHAAILHLIDDGMKNLSNEQAIDDRHSRPAGHVRCPHSTRKTSSALPEGFPRLSVRVPWPDNRTLPAMNWDG